MISLAEVSELCSLLVAAERSVKDKELELSIVKARAQRLREDAIPMAMSELGIDSLQLNTGESVKVKQDVFCAIPADGKEQAYGWLESNGFGGLIKTEVSVSFGKGELEDAVSLANRMREEGMAAELSRSVHAQTMAAFLREQMADPEASKSFPLDLFGARPVWIAKVSPPKKAKL